MASRGALGGLSEATLQAALLMDASGKDDVLIETVGVGQAEIDIVDHADTIVLALMPGSGDSIQALKAGVMEIPDVIVVNKSDHPMTDTMVREIKGVLALGPDGRLAGADPRDRGGEGGGGRGARREDRPRTARTSRPRARSRSAARATCATRCSSSPPRGCGASSRRRSPTTRVAELLERVVQPRARPGERRGGAAREQRWLRPRKSRDRGDRPRAEALGSRAGPAPVDESRRRERRQGLRASSSTPSSGEPSGSSSSSAGSARLTRDPVPALRRRRRHVWVAYERDGSAAPPSLEPGEAADRASRSSQLCEHYGIRERYRPAPRRGRRSAAPTSAVIAELVQPRDVDRSAAELRGRSPSAAPRRCPRRS